MNVRKAVQAVMATLNGSRFELEAPTRRGGGRTLRLTLNDCPSETVTPGGAEFALEGFQLHLATSSHAAALVEVAFDARPAADAWIPLTPGSTAQRPDGERFARFWVRRRSSVPAGVLAEACIFVADPGELSTVVEQLPRTAQLSDSGSAQNLLRALTLAGAEVDLRASDEGALASSAWTGAAYVRKLANAAGRLLTRTEAEGGLVIYRVSGVTGGGNWLSGAGTGRRIYTVTITESAGTPANASGSLTFDGGAAIPWELGPRGMVHLVFPGGITCASGAQLVVSAGTADAASSYKDVA